ncbi:hypothetical protein HMI56_003679 [Coelomomyces lativittatus]|nr:hypothetical protein HMI56_003679 [Coelomomyces lativittatus]
MSYYQSSDGEVDDDVRLPRSMSTHPLEEEFFHEALTDPHETDKVSSSSSSSSSSSLSSSSTSYHENQNQNQSESESESEPHPSQEGSPTDPSLVSTRLGSPLHQVNSMHSEHPFQAMGGGMSTSTELNLNAPPFVPRFL